MKLNIAYSIVALSMMSPTVARLGCPPSWKTGETYASGDLVSVDGIVFQCTNTAYFHSVHRMDLSPYHRRHRHLVHHTCWRGRHLDHATALQLRLQFQLHLS
jgi:hypothetical protein